MKFSNPPMVTKPVMKIQPVQPPKVNSSKSSWDKFKSWLKDNRVISGSLGALSRLEILNKYKDYLITGSKMAESVGYGKKKKSMIKDHNKLCSCIHQHGGSWGDFVGWIKDRANDVANVGKKVGNAVASAGSAIYRRAIRPAYDYVKSRPVSAIGTIAKGLSYIPSPFSGALGTAGTALGTVGTLTGKGQNGGTRAGYADDTPSFLRQDSPYMKFHHQMHGGARKSHTGKVLMVF